MKILYLAIVFQIILLTACAQEKTPESNTGTLIFQSGFEPGSKVIAKGSDADIVGMDNSMTDHNDWVNDFDNHPDIGNFNLQYQGGDSTMRFAKIIPEPGNPANHVLQFWLDKPNVGGSKGRIQGNIYGNKGMKEFYQSVRIFLPNDFNTVRTFPDKISWLTIAEFWNNVTWNQNVPYGFRITLGIGKPVTTESDLYFILDGQDCELFADDSQKYTTLWSETNQKVKVPIGQWFTLEYYYKEGDGSNGKFYMTIQANGVKKEVIYDLTKITHNTKDPNPDGVTDFNPIKLYTSKKLIDYMGSKNKTLQIYWDDFKLWKDKRP
ncbi:MAG: hypothetical protein Q8M67_02530 [Bacteroidota bacterium]|nr:hypothetical protein [Bacteroidota bacterium]